VVKRVQEVLKFRNLPTEEEEAVCKNRIMEKFLQSTLLNYRFKRKAFSHDRKSKKKLVSLIGKVRGKNIRNAPDLMVLGAKEFVQIISHFGEGGL
jgi:hypothetical protein